MRYATTVSFGNNLWFELFYFTLLERVLKQFFKIRRDLVCVIFTNQCGFIL